MPKLIPKICIALVWLINGLFCKVLDLVPRHQMIVARILSVEYAPQLTKAIGLLEILMSIWIISEIEPRWCTWTQIIVVVAMNVIEFILVPDLLLFGRVNIVFATLFIAVVYINGFILSNAEKNSNLDKLP